MTFKEFALQDCNTLEATQTMLESRRVSRFPIGDQEIMIRSPAPRRRRAVGRLSVRNAGFGDGRPVTSIASQSPTPGCPPTDTPGDVDIAALREKYRVERDKRLRVDGSTQYLELTADFAAFSEVDPHTPFVDRDPLSVEADVLILGGGFAGLLAAVALKRAGVEDIRIIEMGGDFGGVWYWNRFPGVQCDNDSYCYMPLLEELDYMPTKKFADGSEIFAHCQRIGKHFGLYDGAIFSTQVRDLNWEDGIARWRVATNRGDDIRARFVVMAAGSFNRPKLPGIPGLREFTGHMFHSSRWDYDYTGGDATGGLHKLATTRRSRSSAPVPPPFRSCPIWRGTPSTSMSFNALRRRSTRDTTRPPTPRG